MKGQIDKHFGHAILILIGALVIFSVWFYVEGDSEAYEQAPITQPAQKVDKAMDADEDAVPASDSATEPSISGQENDPFTDDVIEVDDIDLGEIDDLDVSFDDLEF